MVTMLMSPSYVVRGEVWQVMQVIGPALAGARGFTSQCAGVFTRFGDTMSRRRLAIYLNDHMAASTGAVELVRRAAAANRGNHYGDTLAELRIEIEEDRDGLASIMDRLGIGVDRARKALGWSAEKLGRLKLNGQPTGYSPLPARAARVAAPPGGRRGVKPT